MIDYHKIAQESKASQDKWELERLLETVGKIEPKHILEIGVHLGRSLEVWEKAFHPDILIGLEKDTCYSYDHIPATVLTGVDSGDIETRWKVLHLTDNKPIDFLFIDGDHMHGAVKRDFELYSPLVRKGGIIVFHDARLDDNPTCEVFTFWKEIKNQYRSQELFNPSGEGTGVGVLFL